jgi:hypothetical protein
MTLSKTARVAALSTLGLILIIVLIFAIFGGGYWGGYAWSPVGLLVVVLLILLLTGRL